MLATEHALRGPFRNENAKVLLVNMGPPVSSAPETSPTGLWRLASVSSAGEMGAGFSIQAQPDLLHDGEEYWYALGEPDFEILGL